MSSVNRRNVLQWMAAGLAAVLVRPFRASAAVPTATLPSAPALELLRTEHFEDGRADLETAHAHQLHEMLRDLHGRRDYDASCHAGQPGPHADYLTGWIDAVTHELKTRGHPINL